MTFHWILAGVGVFAAASGVAGLASLYRTGTPFGRSGEDLTRVETCAWALAYLAGTGGGLALVLIVGLLTGDVPPWVLL